MKVLLDTNVYITATRTAVDAAHFRSRFLPLLPITVLSAVVAYELSVNAGNARTRELVADWVNPMQRIGRVVAPTFDDWQSASRVVSAIERKESSWKSKLPHLLNDILIALTGRRAGAEVVTYNGDDFRLIRRHLDFPLRVLPA
jgi:predicted nucleic acid-binding protein